MFRDFLDDVLPALLIAVVVSAGVVSAIAGLVLVFSR
jgi:hypothetical protein